jgi:hypothetical protein
MNLGSLIERKIGVLKTEVLSYLVKKYDMDVELTSETMHTLFQVVDYNWRCRPEHWKTKIQSIVRIIKKDSKVSSRAIEGDRTASRYGGQSKTAGTRTTDPRGVGPSTLYQCSCQSIDMNISKIL